MTLVLPTALLRILVFVTAFFFSCAEPTLFLGSDAAYAVPPSAMNSATSASRLPRRNRTIRVDIRGPSFRRWRAGRSPAWPRASHY